MGTHPIFESDFDCLTDSIGPNLSKWLAKRRLDLPSRKSSPGSTPSTSTSESSRSETSTEHQRPLMPSESSPDLPWAPRTSESTLLEQGCLGARCQERAVPNPSPTSPKAKRGRRL